MSNLQSHSLKLENGSTVLIIGGGPAGCSCAIKLREMSREMGISLRILVFEEKDFVEHFNQCAGVLSPPFVEVLLNELHLDLPANLINRKIFGYRLHVDEHEILLVGEEKSGPTYSVHRVDFDKFLLEYARSHDIEIIPSRVTHIDFVRGREVDEVRVSTLENDYRGEVLVGAFGSDEESIGLFEKATAKAGSYRGPAKFLRAIIARLPTELGFIEKKMGNLIYAFLSPRAIPRIEFGAITPKKRNIFVNIVGEKIVYDDMRAFFMSGEVRKYIPSLVTEKLEYKLARFPTAPARNPYGHRYVIVGDATGWLRPFKGKGINTAVYTGIHAARTILTHGVSKDAFRHYAECCRSLLEDYYYGIFVRFLCNWFSGTLIRPILELAKLDPYLYETLYLSVSGHETFKNITKSVLSLNNMKQSTRIFFTGRRKKRVQNINIRPLTVRDIDKIMKIDEKIMGKPHESFWESKVAAYLEREPGACIAAEVSGTLVGFILGDIRGWEFALPLSGWIEVIGVDKEFQGKGVGKALINALIEYFRQNNIKHIQTMISWDDGDIIDYLRSMGFERGGYINLVKSLKDD